MTNQTTIPTEPGFYWYKLMPNKKWEIVKVSIWKETMKFAAKTFNSTYVDIRYFTGVWGPKIESPKEFLQEKDCYD